MARVRDLWHDKKRRQTARHPDRGGNKDAKRWLAVWIDPDGQEKTKTFATQDAAKKYAAKMEADAERGEYVDPKAGREKFGTLAEKHLPLRKVGATSRVRYESAYRNHVKPVFAERSVKSIRPSEIAHWLHGLGDKSVPLQQVAYLIVQGVLDLAVADGLIRENPARSSVISRPSPGEPHRQAWDMAKVQRVIDFHPPEYRVIPLTAAALGLRQGCVFALAEEDIDWEAEKVTIRRQVTRLNSQHVFKLPKGGKERVVPLPAGLAQVLSAHIKEYPPQPYTLPWLGERGRDQGKITGERTARLLFRWHGDDPRTHGKHIVASSYIQGVWKPALSRAGIIPPPVKDERGIHRYTGGDRDDGMHALRHFYSLTLQDAGVPLVGVMEFLGHSRKSQGVTLAVYGHVTDQTFAAARSAVDRVLFRLHAVGTVTELRQAR